MVRPADIASIEHSPDVRQAGGARRPAHGAHVVGGRAVHVRAAPLVQDAGARAADVAVHAADPALVLVARRRAPLLHAEVLDVSLLAG